MNRKQRRTAAKTARTVPAKAGKAKAAPGSLADAVVQKAIAAAQAGAMTEAEAALDEVLARYPTHIEAMHHKGMLMARGERIADGIALLQRVVEAKGDEALYWNNLAAAQLTASRAADALPAAQNATRLDPKYIMAWQNLAMCFAELGRHREQVDALKQITELAPQDADNWNQLGLAELETGNAEAAETAFRQAVAKGKSKGKAEFLSNLGVLLAQRNRMAEAIPHLEAALNLEPDRFTAALHFGLAQASAGDYPKALRWLRRATSIRPRSDDAWATLADVAEKAGERAEALDAARRAATIAPEKPGNGQRLDRLNRQSAALAPQSAAGEATVPASKLGQIFIR